MHGCERCSIAVSPQKSPLVTATPPVVTLLSTVMLPSLSNRQAPVFLYDFSCWHDFSSPVMSKVTQTSKLPYTCNVTHSAGHHCCHTAGFVISGNLPTFSFFLRIPSLNSPLVSTTCSLCSFPAEFSLTSLSQPFPSSPASPRIRCEPFPPSSNRCLWMLHLVGLFSSAICLPWVVSANFH